MDYFSKWPEVYALPNQEATTVADVLVEQWVSRFGVPMELHSDQGRNFESHVFREVCKLLGIHKTRTTPLHPQSDGMVERFNRTLEQYLTKVVSERQDDWDRHIPLFLLAYRGAVHDTTGETPSNILFGRELRLPCDLQFGSAPAMEHSVSDYVVELQEKLSSVHNGVRNKIKLSSDRMKARYDLRANSTGFKEGEQVWLYNPRRQRGRSPKLQTHWEGPYRVVKRINDVVYRIQRSPKAKMKVVHLDRMTKYYGSNETVRDEQL
jgi:transposase InsO family protein